MKLQIFGKSTFIFFFSLILCGISVNQAHADGMVIRVKPAGIESGTCGETWENACSLPRAISLSSNGDQIWVAAGVYLPTSTADRASSFVMKKGVAIYGGFGGTELELNQRDPSVNITVLSGDVGVPGNNTDNSYHVVSGSGADGSSILDGFTIEKGYADGENPYNRGGGLYAYKGSPVIRNVIFTNNYAASLGGGVFASSSNPSFINVEFRNNSSGDRGGGVYNYVGSSTFTNVLFVENSAVQRGGGVFNYSSGSNLTGVDFVRNASQDLGGGMNNYLSTVSLSDCSFTENSAVTSGGGMYNGGGTI